jgi:hypothetical protein
MNGLNRVGLASFFMVIIVILLNMVDLGLGEYGLLILSVISSFFLVSSSGSRE